MSLHLSSIDAPEKILQRIFIRDRDRGFFKHSLNGYNSYITPKIVIANA